MVCCDRALKAVKQPLKNHLILYSNCSRIYLVLLVQFTPDSTADLPCHDDGVTLLDAVNVEQGKTRCQQEAKLGFRLLGFLKGEIAVSAQELSQ